MKPRRHFLHDLGISAAALPFLSGLPGLRAASANGSPKQRLIIMFSPNGTIPDQFWPDQPKDDAAKDALNFKRILKPLEPFRDRTMLLRGMSNRVGGDGDRHMRGMSCLLTGTELLPGNIQGGSDTPAGWASGISIDQELKNFLQSRDETRTRFGSLEFGVAVPNRADPWTRMSYEGANLPVVSILDTVQADLKRAAGKLSSDDKSLLDQHMTLVRELETRLTQNDAEANLSHPVPDIDPDIELVNNNTPEISRMQIDLLVNSMANDMTRIATLQYMRSVGQARMAWLGIEEGHHGLSHDPDNNKASVEKLTKINEWFCGELAYLTKRLSETPEPGADGSMLDHTLIVWLNELGKGNTHTLDNLPFTLIGGKSHGFKMGRCLSVPDKTPHNRLWLAIAQAMGHDLQTFGTAKWCEGGALHLG